MPHTRQARDQLGDDLRSLARDAEQLLHATMQDMTDTIARARQQLNDFSERMKETCEDLQERSLERAGTAAKQTDKAIRKHPYQTLGIAFGVGLALGLMLRRD
jgi:ElaB/YqjD/DUF883 family membrane-anchored ribosome-binding protein